MSLADLLNQATPGPWMVREEQGSGLWDVVLTDGSYASMSVTEGDAALIALAPDMARLLIDMAALLRDREVYGYLPGAAGDKETAALLARFADLDAKAGS